ncbi:MAG: hypothetical protein EXR98_17355 [Gemmataceae bacterium]|nr:hypothetical protein [Gemmataceae bacterium]
MRRPRAKLQVSTFPFLAVLLCAMGALLLLLFIMDRRAKITAQCQVNELHAKRQERTKAEEDLRQAEWEKAKAALHNSLLEQQNQLNSQAKDLQSNLSDAGKNLDLVQARHLDLQRKLDNESAKIAGLHGQIAGQQSGLQESVKKENASKAELLAAAKELAELERAFQQLRALRERDKETYSVVPYRGKRGDGRLPIYVECVSAGVLFHPEKKLVHGFELTPASVRDEVERRHGPLAIQKATKGKGEEPSGPYVLFLIRPDGIANYYKAQSALKGYQLDFGYELVDQHWTLDFSDSNPRGGPAGQLAKDQPLPVLPPFGAIGGARLDGPVGQPVNGGGAKPGGALGAQGNGGLGSAPIAIVPPSGIGGGGPLIPAPTMPDGPPRIGAFGGTPGKGSSFTPITGQPSLKPIASSNDTQPGGGTNPLGVNTSLLPRTDSAGTKPGTTSTSAGGAGSSGIGNEDTKPRPTFGADQAKKPASQPPPVRVVGNKEFLITIDCQSDTVTVSPGSMHFQWTAANQQGADKALVQSVANLIARRQASVRPGEPPYRPLIRFQVSREGLRMYYHVYPLLELLRVPMTRENVEE